MEALGAGVWKGEEGKVQGLVYGQWSQLRAAWVLDGLTLPV